MKLVTVIGNNESVVKAEEMITFLISNPGADAMSSITLLLREKMQGISTWGSGPPYSTMPNSGQGMTDTNNVGASYGGQSYGSGSGGYGDRGGSNGGGYGQQAHTSSSYGQQAPSQYGGYGGNGGLESEIFPCSKMYMGRVIGQKGVTINDLQKKSGCDIQINQDVPPGQDCDITIKGPRQGIESAKKMLIEIIEMGPNHPHAGGGGSGVSRQGYGHQHNAYGHQQGTYNQPHQPQQQQYGQQPYGQQQYGMQPQQQFVQPQQPQQQTPMYGGGGYQQPQQPQQPYGYQQQQQPQQYPQQQQPFGYQQPAPMGLQGGAIVSPWKVATAPDGQSYYYNEKTGATTWEKPAGM